ncbi:hypothetical protein D3C72_2316620 [compost metagenome]
MDHCRLGIALRQRSRLLMIKAEKLIERRSFRQRTFRTQHVSSAGIHQNDHTALVGRHNSIAHIRQNRCKLLFLLLILR